MTARLVERLAEVGAQKRNLATVVCNQLLDLPQSLQLRSFASDRPLMQLPRKPGQVLWSSQAPVAQADTLGADFEQLLLAEIVERADDPVAIGPERPGGGLHVDREPRASFGRLPEDARQELAALPLRNARGSAPMSPAV